MFIVENETMENFKNIVIGKRIFAFGAGNMLNEFCDIYTDIAKNISFCVDNNSIKWGSHINIGHNFNINIISPQELCDKITDQDILLITTIHYKDVIAQLFDNEKLNNISCYIYSNMDMYINNEVLKKVQEIEFEMLNEFVNICEKHNLSYYLIGGTLLGAVRHGDFIPWDDDLDVAMPRDDFKKFADLYYKELNKKYYFHWINTDKTYWLPFAKIRKNNTVFNEKSIRKINTHKGIYIDVFPLDSVKKQKSMLQDMVNAILQNFNAAILIKRGLSINFQKDLLLLKLKLPLTFLVKARQKIMMLLNSPKNDYYANWGSNYNYIKQTIKKSVYGEGKKIQFRNREFNVPNDYEYILSRIYGKDYMKLPPKEKRITHSPLNIEFDE